MKTCDKIRFLNDVVDGPLGHRQGICYAKKGDIGKIIEVKADGDELWVLNDKKKFMVYPREVKKVK